MGKVALGKGWTLDEPINPKSDCGWTVADTLRKHVPGPHKPNGAVRSKPKFLQ
jgi:hypothetical protein